MPRSLAVFCFVLLLLRPEEGGAEGVGQARDFLGEDDRLLGGFFEVLPRRTGTRKGSLLTKLRESPSALHELAAKVKEILDRISMKWALEGARTIQNGEIRLRKMYKDVNDEIEELATRSTKHGRHIVRCLNETQFETGLKRILNETTDCYARSLESVHKELKRLEDHENLVLAKINGFATRMLAMLSECFHEETSGRVTACLERVDRMNLGSEMRHKETEELSAVAEEAIVDVSATVSECTSKGLADTEAHIRKGYARSLTCLAEHP